MELQLKIIGCLFLLLAILHLFFPGYFKWKQDLAPLSLINRQMMYVHAYFIALAIFLLGLLCLTSGNLLLGTTLGRRICLGAGVFWTARLYVQFFVYSSKLWKGKTFELISHVVFSFFWAYVSIVFLLGYFEK